VSQGHRRSKTDLLFEKIPPFITFMLIIFPFWGGYIIPEATAYFVIIFNVFFLYKSSSFVIFFAYSLIKIRESEHVNWLNRVIELEDIDLAMEGVKGKLASLKDFKYEQPSSNEEQLNKLLEKRQPGFMQKLVFRYERYKAKRFLGSELNRLAQIKKEGVNYDWREIHHVIIIPHWREPEHVLDTTLEKIAAVNYPTNKISIVLGAEKRDPEGFEVSEKMKQKFADRFEHIWISVHELTEEEIIGKSSNMAFAGKTAAREIEKLGWDLKKVTVTSCDADLTYEYITRSNSIYKFYNAAMVLYANIWRLPFYARVKNSMSTIYNVARLVRTDKLVPFSTYTTSFWLIDQIGYWTPWITPEDFHVFFKALIKFPHQVSTIPIYQRILADAAEGSSHFETIKNNYFQERRWSWGISDDGWLLKNLLLKITRLKATPGMIYRGLHVIFDHIIGPVSSVIILFGGNIPLLVNPAFAATTIGINLPGISSFIIQLTIWLLFIAIFLDQYLKPARTGKKSPLRRIFYWVEWVTQPFIG